MHTRRSYLLTVVLFFLSACSVKKDKRESVKIISDTGQQELVFGHLIQLTNQAIPADRLNDSLAFLILPIQASCPSCRKKAIDSIISYKDRLPARHYIILSANGGRKKINSFFREQHEELPVIENRLFLDSLNQAYKSDLYKDKPTMYYTDNKKAFKRVESIPATVRDDLSEFFSNHGSGYTGK